MSKANTLTSAIVEYCNYNGCFVWRNNTVGVYDPVKKVFRKNRNQLNGVSDIIGVRKKDGKFIAIEVKIGNDRLKDAQINFKYNLISSNALYFEAKKLDDFIFWFNENVK